MTPAIQCLRPIPILTYHQIDKLAAPGSPYRELTVEPQAFATHMQWLHKLGYRGLSMQDLQPYLNGEKTGRVFGLTFDDGYVNVLEHVTPVLSQLSFTATSYMVAGQVSGSNAWDLHQGIGQSPLVSRAQMLEWIAAGNEIGSHTIDHVNLPTLAPDEARRQIQDSRAMLQDTLGMPVEAFCFPYGQLADIHVEMAREAGYRDATTTHPGRVQAGQDRLRLPRIMMYCTTGFHRLLLQLATPLEDIRAYRRSLRQPPP